MTILLPLRLHSIAKGAMQHQHAGFASSWRTSPRWSTYGAPTLVRSFPSRVARMTPVTTKLTPICFTYVIQSRWIRLCIWEQPIRGTDGTCSPTMRAPNSNAHPRSARHMHKDSENKAESPPNRCRVIYSDPYAIRKHNKALNHDFVMFPAIGESAHPVYAHPSCWRTWVRQLHRSYCDAGRRKCANVDG